MSEQKRDSNLPVGIALVVVMLAFYFGGIWIGLAAFLVSAILLGWKNRFDGPFRAQKGNEHDVDLTRLQTQFTGRRFADLVLQHANQQSLEQIERAALGTMNNFPKSFFPDIELLLDEMNEYLYSRDFWDSDCGDVFADVLGRAKAKLIARNQEISNEKLFDMFNLVVLNFARGALMQPKMAEFIK